MIPRPRPLSLRERGTARRITFCGLLALISLAGPLRAQTVEPIETDRPDQTESTGTIAPSVVQVEAGWTVARDVMSAPETLLRFGVASRLELRAGWAGWHDTGAVSGAGDLEAGFKYGITRRGGTAVSLLADVALPSGVDAFSEGQVVPAMRVLVSHDLGRWSTGYNLGVSISDVTEGLYTWTVAYSAAERLGVFAETFGTVGLGRGGAGSMSFDGGMTWQLRPNLQFDLLAGRAVAGTDDQWFFGAGVAVRVPR